MNLFELFVKIGVDDQASGKLKDLGGKLGNGLKTAAKIGTAAVGAAAAGITALTTAAVKNYAEYEQLVGGVETLFKESQNIVTGYAENAYKTAGMSANQYMETVTSFSASLIQSLDGDTAKAAKVADMAITDMSDNANKMGTDISMIQNAYNGFAKGNFTMLDNLKLGYGGTKEEMQRLLDKAGEISGIKYDISSFADISEAIHVIQQDLEISGISYEEAMQRVANGEMTMEEAMAAMGTTAREAATTIEGSLSMMKGAWENLVVGMADENANTEVLINNFVESTATAAQNLLPRIEQTLKGIGDLITALAPVIAEALPVLVEAVLPSLLTAGVSLVTAIVNGVVTALPALYTALLEAVQIILVEVFGVSEEKAGEFADSINSFFAGIKDGFAAMVESAQTEGTVLNDLWTKLQTAFSIVKEFLVEAFNVVSSAFSDIADQFNTDGTWLNETWDSIIEAVRLWQEYLAAAFDKMSETFEWCVEQINTSGTTLNKIWTTIRDFAVRTWENIQTFITAAIEVVKGVIKMFTAILQGDWSAAWDAVKSILENAWEAIKEAVSTNIDEVCAIITTVMELIKGVFSESWDRIKKSISDVWDGIKTSVSDAIENVKSSISTGLETAKSTITGILDAIHEKFSSIFEGAKKIVTDAINAIKGVFDFEWSLPDLKLPHISVSGGKAPYGIGGKGSLPSFDIQWYKKAYDNAMILSNPTIFGYSDGKFLGGGDGNGNEVVAGESHLMGMIGHVVESNIAGQGKEIVALLSALLEAIVDGNTETVRALMADRTFAVGEREFARLVKQYA